jgi:hypothetical protein
MTRKPHCKSLNKPVSISKTHPWTETFVASDSSAAEDPEYCLLLDSNSQSLLPKVKEDGWEKESDLPEVEAKFESLVLHLERAVVPTRFQIRLVWMDLMV